MRGFVVYTYRLALEGGRMAEWTGVVIKGA